jgi:hypothetical protein
MRARIVAKSSAARGQVPFSRRSVRCGVRAHEIQVKGTGHLVDMTKCIVSLPVAPSQFAGQPHQEFRIA